MVNTPRRSLGRYAVLPCMAAALAAGCGVVPRAQLDECRQRGQALRAENDRLKDQVLTLRSENQDIAQRSVDDERRLKAQDEAIERLEQSAQEYQDDRERLAAAYERLKDQLQGNAGPTASQPRNDLEHFAHALPGASFDDRAGVLALPVDALFESGAPRLRPSADELLAELAAALAGPDLRTRTIVLATPNDDEDVRQTSGNDATDEEARLRFLAMARVNQVRQRLAQHHDIDPSRIRIADPDRANPRVPPGKGRDQAPAPIEIRLARAVPRGNASGP